MATYVPPKRGVAFKCWVALVSQADTKKFQANPTLAAGDVKVSLDGGALANLTTLPAVAPAAGTLVQVDLSAAEMTADNVSVVFIDAAGAEWCDLMLNLRTTTRQIDDLAFPTTSGRNMDVDANGGVEVGSYQAGAITAAAFAAGAIDAASTAASHANKIADHVLRRTFANARASADGDAVSLRSLLGAVAKLVNKWAIGGSTLTIYAEDDATALGTQTITATPGADPITTLDTV